MLCCTRCSHIVSSRPVAVLRVAAMPVICFCVHPSQSSRAFVHEMARAGFFALQLLYNGHV